MTRQTAEEFIQKATAVWGDKYDYSPTLYRGPLVRVTIICSRHGPFEQFPYNHLAGHGCRRCGREAVRLTAAEFVARARVLFGEYDYSQVKYETTNVPVTIICPTHGPFERRPANLLFMGQGCAECCREPRARRGPELKLDWQEFVIIRWALRTYRQSRPSPKEKAAESF